MNNTDTAGDSWERIQSGVRETERLLGQKKYNMAMVKARQTLEFMVKCLCDRNGIMESGLVDMIDTLYEEGIISKTTCEHYHKIRIIGNKAIHEDDNTAYDANQSHHLLSQEVYTFANDYGSKRRKTAARASSRSTASRPSSSRNASSNASSRQASSSRSASGRPSQSDRSGRSSRSSSSKSRKRGKAPTPIGPQDIIKILIPLAIIVLLIIIIRMVAPDKKEVPDVTETPSVTATMEESLETTTEPEPTTAESSTAVLPVTYKTTTTLNVRNKPSTTDSTVLGKLAPDTAVNFIRDENEEWAVIEYNGEEAYVSKEYLKEATE